MMEHKTIDVDKKMEDRLRELGQTHRKHVGADASGVVHAHR